jgi:hypothetical protein
VRAGAGLAQVIWVTVRNESDLPATAWLVWRTTDGLTGTEELPHGIPVGEFKVRLCLPERRAPTSLELELVAGDQVMDRRTANWQPARHWELYIVPASHHDLGYTDLPSNVLREHDRFLDQVLDFCDQTANFPADARFHYTVEQGWSVLHYLEHRPAAQTERLLHRLREGRVELTATLGNQTSELCGHEEQVRLLYPVFRFARQAGVPVETAELNDVPGLSWGLAGVLAGAGVRYFSASLPDYLGWGRKVRPLWDEAAVLPRDLPGAFWWQGPDGRRVLLWHACGGSGTLWTHEQAEHDIPRFIDELAQRGYPHHRVRVHFQAGWRDNSPPDVRISHIAREWNARYAYPRLIVSSGRQFFAAFETEAGATLPTLRGELPNTDYTVGATSTPRETGINRTTHGSLLAAERLATCAALARRETDGYPAETLAEAYESALLYDEHTWGMAHPIGPAQDACWSQKGQFAYRAAALAHDVLVKSANRLADALALPGAADTYHLVVCNPSSQARSDIVTVPAAPPSPCGRPMYWRREDESGNLRVLVGGTAVGRDLVSLPADLLMGPCELTDMESGQAVLCQVVEHTDPLAARPLAAQRLALGEVDPTSVPVLNYDRSQRLDLVFTAHDIPPLGYKTYRLRPAAARGADQELSAGQPATPPEEAWRLGPAELENRFYRVQLDPQTGAVRSLYDKELQRELIDGSAAYGFGQVIARSPRSGEVTSPGSATISPGEYGPVCASLVVRGAAASCPVRVMEITLYRDLKRVDLAVRLLRDATPHLELAVAFPFAVDRPRFGLECSNAVVEPVQDQWPGSNTAAYAVQHWVTVQDAACGVAWSSLEAPVVALSQFWPDPLSQAHHGMTQPGFERAFLSDPAELTRGHIYSYLMVSNYRTNFQPVQAGEMLFHYRLTSAPAQALPAAAQEIGRALTLPLVPVCLRGPQDGQLPMSSSFLQIDRTNVALQALKAAEDGDGLILRLAETAGQETEVTVTLPYCRIAQAVATDVVERDTGSVPHTPHTFRVRVPARGMVTVRCRDGQAWPAASQHFYS